MSAGRFAGKVALVTGAASGIGAALATLLVRDGVAGLVLVDRNAAALRDFAGTLALPASAVLCQAQDVADADAWGTLEPQIAERFGRLDLAVANAGEGMPEIRIEDMAIAAWRRVVATNLDGSFLTLRLALRLMRRGGAGGAAVVLSSATAARAHAGMAPYSVSKAAVAHLARVAAKEVAGDGIRVNAVQPGGVATPLFRGLGLFDKLVAQTGSEAAAFSAIAQRSVPMGRFSSAEETAGHIAFLLSDAAAMITGAVLAADGGMTL